jgi:hypothetical protein
MKITCFGLLKKPTDFKHRVLAGRHIDEPMKKKKIAFYVILLLCSIWTRCDIYLVFFS